MTDEPPTIDHDPLERHRGKPTIDKPKREPILGPGLWPFILMIAVSILVVRFVARPFADFVGAQACDKLDFCTNEERAAKTGK